MKKDKKTKKFIPDVHILGDLKDVRKLIKLSNKKKNLVIYRNGETGTLYANNGKKMLECSDKDISKLGTGHRLIYFDFFPGSKASVTEEKAAVEAKMPRQRKPRAVRVPRKKRSTVKKAVASVKEQVEKVVAKRGPRAKKAIAPVEQKVEKVVVKRRPRIKKAAPPVMEKPVEVMEKPVEEMPITKSGTTEE